MTHPEPQRAQPSMWRWIRMLFVAVLAAALAASLLADLYQLVDLW